MKKSLLLLIISLSSIILQAQNLTAPIKNSINKYLSGWTKSFKNFNLSDFKKNITSPKFENINVENFEEINEFYSIYKPIITFSKDKSQFIDIYSYELNLQKRKGNIYYAGSEPDQAIHLCNLKTKRWERISFFTTTSGISDVIWISKTKFILVGEERDEKQKAKYIKYKPVIYIGDTELEAFEIYDNLNTNCTQSKEGYKSPKLKKIKIIEEE